MTLVCVILNKDNNDTNILIYHTIAILHDNFLLHIYMNNNRIFFPYCD